MVGRHVEPQLVGLDRSTQFGVPFPVDQVRLAGRVAARRRAAVRVRADEAARLVRDFLEAGELVAAALDRRDDRRAGRVHAHVLTGRADRDFILREVVLVDARAAAALGRIHAVGDDTRLVGDAERVVPGLLALVAAAHIDALHAHAGRLRERAPQVGRRRHALELRQRLHVADGRRLRVHHRRLARDRHALLQARNLHRRVDRERLAGRQHDVLRA